MSVVAVPQRAEVVADVGGLRRKLRCGIGEIEEIEAATGMAITRGYRYTLCYQLCRSLPLQFLLAQRLTLSVPNHTMAKSKSSRVI